jgi:hypothetical protein
MPPEGTAPPDDPQRAASGGGVLSTALAVLLMPALGALIWAAFYLLR